MWPVSWALSLSGLTPETWRLELQKQDIELLLIKESSMWVIVTAYTLAGLHWFWRKMGRSEKTRDALADQSASFFPPSRCSFLFLRRFHIKVHLFKHHMTLPNTEYVYITRKLTSRVIGKLLKTIRKSAPILPFKSRRSTDCRSFTSRSSQLSQIQSAEQMFDAACERK